MSRRFHLRTLLRALESLPVDGLSIRSGMLNPRTVRGRARAGQSTAPEVARDTRVRRLATTIRVNASGFLLGAMSAKLCRRNLACRDRFGVQGMVRITACT